MRSAYVYCMAVTLCLGMHFQSSVGKPSHMAIKTNHGSFSEYVRGLDEQPDLLGSKAPEKGETAMRKRVKKPPKYMMDLYNAGAYANSNTKAPELLGADIVRSISNIDSKAPKFCKFDLSAITDDEIILDAELHLFLNQKTFRSPIETSASDLNYQRNRPGGTYLVKIYQFLSDSAPQVKRLVAARRLASYHGGWQTFPILSTVREWLLDTDNNHGLATEMTSTFGEEIDNSLARESHQPMLVVFTKYINDVNPVLHDRRRGEMTSAEQLSRKKREVALVEKDRHGVLLSISPKTTHQMNSSTSAQRACRRYPSYVDFRVLEWNWIIHPRGYDAYRCQGLCFSSCSDSYNHAAIQSTMHNLVLSQQTRMPCCGPDKMSHLSLLYFDNNNNIVYSKVENMVVESCACR